jgi:hypothetical protein
MRTLSGQSVSHTLIYDGNLVWLNASVGERDRKQTGGGELCGGVQLSESPAQDEGVAAGTNTGFSRAGRKRDNYKREKRETEEQVGLRRVEGRAERRNDVMAGK